MVEECFNCNGGAPERYTLLFESGRILEGKPLCSACVAGLGAEEWIEVVEGPVVVRGEDEE